MGHFFSTPFTSTADDMKFFANTYTREVLFYFGNFYPKEKISGNKSCKETKIYPNCSEWITIQHKIYEN